MSKITHPYVLLSLVALATAAMTFSLARKRAEFSRIRNNQEEILSRLIATSEQADYLTAKRRELLSNPAAIAEVAKDQYGYVRLGWKTFEFEDEDIAPGDEAVSIRITESGPARFLGAGEYLWQIPVAVLGICAAIFGILGFFEIKKSDTAR